MIDCELTARRGGFTLQVQYATNSRKIGLVGPSGSGKSSFLRLLAGLDRPLSGRIAFGGEVWFDSDRGVWVEPHRRSIGYVFQSSALFPHLDVRGNIHYAHRRARTGGIELSLNDIIKRVGVEHLLDRNPANLSGGEKQRVAMARALASSPRLLLLDEPLASLDRDSKASILPFLTGLCRELKLPLVYVTHAVEELDEMAEEIVEMKSGQIVSVASARPIALAGNRQGRNAR